MNISDHVTKLRNWMEFKKYSPQSVKNYCSNFVGFLAHFERQGVTHPDRISAEMIINFLKQFNEPATHSGYHSAIKIYYEKVAHIGIEKFKYIERPRKNKKLPIVLSVSEIQKLFDVCENLKHRTILAVLYSCGLRVSELINLKWCDIDRERRVINIIQAKGGKDRQVPLDDKLIQLLTAYWKQYRSVMYVFNGQSGAAQYSDKSVNEVLKHLASKAGIRKKIHAHLIRHCQATHLVEAGTDINIIQRILGHASVKTTAIYTHISHNIISRVQTPLTAITMHKNYFA